VIVPERPTFTATSPGFPLVGDFVGWSRRVFGAALAAMQASVDLSSTYDLETVEGRQDAVGLWRSMACCVTAYCSVATGGINEQNFNVGRVPCDSTGDCYRGSVTTDGRRGGLWGAFDSLEAGVVAFVAWVQRSTVRGWELLGTGALGFWPYLQRAAGLPETSVTEAVQAFNNAAAWNTVPELGREEVTLAGQDWREAAGASGREDGPPATVGLPTVRRPAEAEPATAPPRVVRPGYAYSATLGREVPNGACVQSARDRLYYQARAGQWALCPGGVCPATCVERYQLATGSSSSSSAGPFLLLGAGWALWWVMGRR
jgi:hypothetical protein